MKFPRLRKPTRKQAIAYAAAGTVVIGSSFFVIAALGPKAEITHDGGDISNLEQALLDAEQYHNSTLTPEDVVRSNLGDGRTACFLPMNDGSKEAADLLACGAVLHNGAFAGTYDTIAVNYVRSDKGWSIVPADEAEFVPAGQIPAGFDRLYRPDGLEALDASVLSANAFPEGGGLLEGLTAVDTIATKAEAVTLATPLSTRTFNIGTAEKLVDGTGATVKAPEGSVFVVVAITDASDYRDTYADAADGTEKWSLRVGDNSETIDFAGGTLNTLVAVVPEAAHASLTASFDGTEQSVALTGESAGELSSKANTTGLYRSDDASLASSASGLDLYVASGIHEAEVEMSDPMLLGYLDGKDYGYSEDGAWLVVPVTSVGGYCPDTATYTLDVAVSATATADGKSVGKASFRESEAGPALVWSVPADATSFGAQVTAGVKCGASTWEAPAQKVEVEFATADLPEVVRD